MRVLLPTIGSAGDVHPFAAIGRAMRARGHEVTLITNAHFAPLAQECGLEFAAIGTEEHFRALVADPNLFGNQLEGLRILAREGILPGLRPLYELIMELYVPGETVVAASTLSLGARLAQEKHGVPLATVHLQPTLLPTIHDIPVAPPWVPLWLKTGGLRLGDLIFDRLVAGGLNEVRSDLGLPPVRRVLWRWLHSPQRILGLFPEWYAPAQPDRLPQVRLTGFPLFDGPVGDGVPVEVLEFLEAGDPPIVFTPGTAMAHAGAFFRESVKACELLHRRGLLLTRHRAQLPEHLPKSVLHCDFLPFSRVLPHAGAFVHHGGVGTVSQGLAAGVPQLVMPLSFDQPDHAARLRRMGVGAVVSPGAYRAPRVARVLSDLMTSKQVRSRCDEIAARFTGVDPMPSTCEWIEELVRESR